jgi:pyridoxamine 5'-phosphate oxidase
MAFDFDNPPVDPVPSLKAWLDAAWREANVPNPSAMTLCTIGSDGAPHARIVLLKDLNADGAVFFTNRQSAKGRELAQDPRVALVLHWDHMARQVRIEGEVTTVDDAQSDAYFASRHPASRLGAWASDQSKPCQSRAELMQRLESERLANDDADNPGRPPHWGGYRVSLQVVEFWQAGEHRLHDRVRYERVQGHWTSQRLFP